MRFWRPRFDVFDQDGQCAGNLRYRDACEYARGRSSLLRERSKNPRVLVVPAGFKL